MRREKRFIESYISDETETDHVTCFVVCSYRLFVERTSGGNVHLFLDVFVFHLL